MCTYWQDHVMISWVRGDLVAVETKNVKRSGGSDPSYSLIGLEGALSLDRADGGELYSKYVNSGLKTLLSMLGFDRSFVRAQDIEVYDAEGNRYLDFLGGYGCLPFGHNPRDILTALDRVNDRPNFLPAQVSALQAALSHDLAQITPGDLEVTFLCNSGTESVESGLKLAKACNGNGAFIYCTGAFHGKTLGALSVGGREKYKKPFLPLLPNTVEIPFGDADALEKVLRTTNVAAFVVEPIQGEGGVLVPPEGYMRKVRELTEHHGALLIVDEVQTGFGRTGAMFACETERVVPDVLCLAKALGGGVMPIGATVATKKVWEKAYGGLTKAVLHTSTFGGGGRACAAALASIEKIAIEDLPARAKTMGDYLLAGLKTLQERFKTIEEVRGRGLLIGVEFKKPVSGILDALTAGVLNKVSEEYYAALVAGDLIKKHRVITAYTLNNPNVMRLEPPLTVGKEHIDFVLNALEDTFAGNRGFFRMAAGMLRNS